MIGRVVFSEVFHPLHDFGYKPIQAQGCGVVVMISFRETYRIDQRGFSVRNLYPKHNLCVQKLPFLPAAREPTITFWSDPFSSTTYVTQYT